MSVIPSIIGAVGSLLGGGLNAATSLKAAKMQNDANLHLAKYSYQQQQQQIDKQNEYNSPSAQMQRYADAGLNPHLIYGDGNSNSGNQSSIAQYHAPSITAPQLGDFGVAQAGNQLMQGLVTAAEIRKKEAETSLINQNVLNAQEDNKIKQLVGVYQNLRNQLSDKELSVFDERFESLMRQQETQSVLNFANAQRSDSERFLTDINREYASKLNIARIEQLLSSAAYSRSGAQLSQAQIGKVAYEIDNLLKQGANIDSQTERNALDNQIKSILVKQGLNISNDDLDRLVYLYDKNNDTNASAFVKAMQVLAKTIGKALHQ